MPWKAWLGNANHRHRMVVDPNGAANDVRRRSEAILPVVVRDHDDGVRSRLQVVGVCDEPSEKRADAEHRKVGAGDDLGADRLGTGLDCERLTSVGWRPKTPSKTWFSARSC